jgi:hypothetical protein
LPQSLTDDKQNIHDGEINMKNIKISENLIKTYPPAELTAEEILIIGEEMVDKYKSNFAVFGKTEFSLYNLLCSVVTFSRNCEHKDELYRILNQQLLFAEKLCSTGKMGNIVSAIQGFANNDSLTFKLSDNHFMETHLVNYINKKIQNCIDEKVIEGLLDKNETYIKFVTAAAEEWKIEAKDRFEFNNRKISKIIDKKYFQK